MIHGMPLAATLYDRLEVSPQASPPDKQANDAAANEHQAQINAAYAVLSDPARRKRYDQELVAKPCRVERRMAHSQPFKRQTAGDQGADSEAPRSRPFVFRPLA
jgi:curved DNA-binding protein CbpA